MPSWVAMFGLLIVCVCASPAEAACTLHHIAELPVTMIANRPLVPANINGVDVTFIADSGAFYSMITPEGAKQLHLPISPVPHGLRIQGVGGSPRVSIAKVETFALDGSNTSNMEFIVGGNDIGSSATGVLGQNVLGTADVEYDIANGRIRLIRPIGCEDESLAYWATAKPVSRMAIETLDAAGRHTTGSVEVNGVLVQAAFDTGASHTLLSLLAAQRAGIKLDGSDVTFAGYVGGVGPSRVKTWMVTVESLQIGAEAMKNARVRIGDIDLGDIDMLIGIDFFRSHRVYVANSQHKVYFSLSER